MKKNKRSVLILGAGISGLLAARTLQDRGLEVTVVDKGRGVGGRMATRRIEEGVFDHGAQFFTVREPKFQKLVDGWVDQGIAVQWTRGFANEAGESKLDGYPRFRGVPSMTGIPKALAKDLDLRIAKKVTTVSRNGGEWRLETEIGEVFTADGLILTAPVPQSLALLDAGGTTLSERSRRALVTLEYDPCIAMMVLTQNPPRLPDPGAVQLQRGDIRWVADNTRKGVSPNAHALTVHTCPDFSRNHWKSEKEKIAQILLKAAERWIDGPVRTWQIHKWRYSQPQQAYPDRCLSAPGLNLVFAGDAFGGPRVEGAAMSGLTAGEQMAASLTDLKFS